MKLDLVSILHCAGLDRSKVAGMARHQDSDFPLEDLRRTGEFELYQAYQARPVFDRFKQIVSFYGAPESRAIFHGLYHVRGRAPVAQSDRPENYRHYADDRATIFYKLERDPRFDFLQDRMVIEWKGARSWVQKLAPRSIVEIKAEGRRLPLFTDYLEFSLTFAQLEHLMTTEEAHRDWASALSAVAGVYLILDKEGKQYVGSAQGTSGIWGRWQEYARNGNGGNKKLLALQEKDPSCHENFLFSVLQVLPNTMSRTEVLKRESAYMRKLGTRATGLN